MTKLSVNVNKVATLRNTRHSGIPSVVRAARLCLEENGIEPTPTRIRALAQAAESAVSDIEEGDEEEQAA